MHAKQSEIRYFGSGNVSPTSWMDEDGDHSSAAAQIIHRATGAAQIAFNSLRYFILIRYFHLLQSSRICSQSPIHSCLSSQIVSKSQPDLPARYILAPTILPAPNWLSRIAA